MHPHPEAADPRTPPPLRLAETSDAPTSTRIRGWSLALAALLFGLRDLPVAPRPPRRPGDAPSGAATSTRRSDRPDPTLEGDPS